MPVWLRIWQNHRLRSYPHGEWHCLPCTSSSLREYLRLPCLGGKTGWQAPVLLRLVFHDAGTFLQAAGNGGANASIRFELSRPENSGLNRGWGVIEAARKNLHGTPAAWLSHADLIALAGAYAVGVTGGPSIDVPVGEPQRALKRPCSCSLHTRANMRVGVSSILHLIIHQASKEYGD